MSVTTLLKWVCDKYPTLGRAFGELKTPQEYEDLVMGMTDILGRFQYCLGFINALKDVGVISNLMCQILANTLFETFVQSSGELERRFEE